MLVLVLAVALSAVRVGAASVRVQDAAREAARAAARGDPDTARSLVAEAAPGAQVSIETRGDRVVAVVTLRVPVAGRLGSVTVTGRSVAAAEPDGPNGIPP